MATTTFTNGVTLTDADWFNDVDAVVYEWLGDGTNEPSTRAAARNNLFTGGTVTTSTPVISATQTWNDGAVTFTGLKLNITDTASAAASLLLDLQVGAASKCSVKKNGLVTSAVGFAGITNASNTASTIGEIVTSSNTGTNITTANQNIGTITVTAGKWLIAANVNIDVDGNGTRLTRALVGISTDSTNGSFSDASHGVNRWGHINIVDNTISGAGINFSYFVNINSTTSYYLKAETYTGAGNVAYRHQWWAIRVG